MRDEMIGCCGNYIFGESMSFETDHDLDSSPYLHSEAQVELFAGVYTSPEIQEKFWKWASFGAGNNEVSIRKPDLAVILHSNPVEAKPLDRSFHGVCDLCIEFLSDSTPAEVERDTVHKKKEYANAGVAEYYILDRLHMHTAFYCLNEQGVYERMKHQEPGVIHSRVLDRFAFRLEDLEKQVAFETLIEDPLYQPFLLKSFQQERQQKEQERQLKEKERQQKEKECQQKEQERQLKENAWQEKKLPWQEKKKRLRKSNGYVLSSKRKRLIPAKILCPSQAIPPTSPAHQSGSLRCPLEWKTPLRSKEYQRITPH